MIKVLFDSFLEARDKVIKEVFKYVDSTEKKEVELPYEKCYTIIEEELYTQIYTKLFIKNNTLYIEYECCEGYNLDTMETYTDEFDSLSMNEIYDVITKIK